MTHHYAIRTKQHEVWSPAWQKLVDVPQPRPLDAVTFTCPKCAYLVDEVPRLSVFHCHLAKVLNKYGAAVPVDKANMDEVEWKPLRMHILGCI
jgi:hypothetical protein